MANAKSNRSLYGTSIILTDTISGQKSQTRKVRSQILQPNEVYETLIVVPPDGGWGWVVVLATFFTNFVADGTMYTFAIFVTDISTDIGATKTQVAIVNSLMAGFYYLSGIRFFGTI